MLTVQVLTDGVLPEAEVYFGSSVCHRFQETMALLANPILRRDTAASTGEG